MGERGRSVAAALDWDRTVGALLGAARISLA
jgi:hypothetical protein